jgi:recombinational DNA repair protein (RecF pathway)
MQEYTARALILRKEPSREMDLSVTMFTDQFGKITAKAKSARKITSKLSAHLEPGNLSAIRLAEKNGLHLTDAFKESRLALTPHDLYALDRLLHPEEADPHVWGFIKKSADGVPWRWPDMLALLGWDPRETQCEKCHTRQPRYFLINTQSLYCEQCTTASRVPQDALLYLGNDTNGVGIGRSGSAHA